MKIIAFLVTLVAIAQGATVVPIESSVVNVQSGHAGQDYSYSIQENHGFAINPPAAVQSAVHLFRTAPEVPGSHQIRPQPFAKTVLEQSVPEHGVPVGSYPTTYLSYVPISYQYGFPYGYTHPYNFLSYKVA